MAYLKRMRMIPYTFVSDPGHGWLVVSKEEARLLDCKFSPYSYQDDDNLYLEEDYDAGVFVRAWQKRYGPHFKTIDDVTNHSSVIRSYRRVSGEFLDKKLK